MKKIIAVLVVVITFSSMFFFLTFMLKPEKKVNVIHNNKTYDVVVVNESTLFDKNDKKKITDRKNQILKEINDINSQLGKAIKQDKIDSLADKKEKLVKEYQELERGELNGKK